MNDSNQVFVITFAIIGLGFLLKQYDFVTEKDGKIISKFLMHSTFPALMLISTATLQLDTSLLLIPFFAFGLGSLMMLIGWLWFGNYDHTLRGVLTMGLGGFNTGLFGFPIIEGLFGKQSLVYAIMFDVGNTLFVFGVIYTVGGYFSPNKTSAIRLVPILKKICTIPPFLAMIVGLIINVLSLQMPVVCVDFLEVLARGNKPIALLLMGIYLSVELSKKAMIGISKVLLIRYVVGLLVAFGLYFLLPNYPTMRNVLMVCVLLPIGMTILPFSDEMHYDSRIAGTLLNCTLLLSFGLIWILVSLIGL
jgi:predicted permease